MRRDPNSTEIETVGIPAGLDRHIGMRPLVGVAFAGTIQQPEFVVVEIENTAPKLGGELSGTRSMFRISDFVDPPRIVQDGEQGDDIDARSGRLSQFQAILKDSGPVPNTMIAVQWQGVVFENGLEDGLQVHPVILPSRFLPSHQRWKLENGNLRGIMSNEMRTTVWPRTIR